MLKLSSNYAKSYMRDTSSQQPQRTRLAGTQRFYPPASEHDFDLPKKSMHENDFRRQKFDYKQSPISSEMKNDYAISNDAKVNKEKMYGYTFQNTGNPRNDEAPYRQDFGEYQRKQRNYDEPLNDIDTNYRDKSPRTISSRRNNPPSTYQFELPSQNDQNYEADLKGYKYSKYSGRGAGTLDPSYAIEKKQYTVKHSRRNEQVKNRILKELSYGREPYGKNPYDDRQQRQTSYDNYLNDGAQPYDNYRNQEEYRQSKQDYQNAYKNSRKLQFDTFDKQDDWKTERQSRNNYENPSGQQQYPQEIYSKQRNDDYAIDKFDRPLLNERKQSIKKSIEGTPQKGYKGKFEPGSAERKNSLIQKSQMLQEKLKKLNMQYPGGEREKEKEVNNFQQSYQPQRPVSRNIAPQNEEIYSRYTPSPHVQSTLGNRSSSCLKNNFRNISIGQGERDITSSIRNADNLRIKNQMLDSDNGSQLPIKGEAIEKITKLNEKINERIQSIISNYAKK